MMNKVLVIAPHPDDETIGCAGTLLKLKNEQKSINCIIVTRLEDNFSDEKIKIINRQIENMKEMYQFDYFKQLEFATMTLDKVPMMSIIESISNVVMEIKPDTIFIPFINDVHTDHYYVARACMSFLKWFRYPYIKQAFYYETLSETDQNFDVTVKNFEPNFFVNIEQTFEEKLKILEKYESEISEFPFPRSIEAVKSLSKLRGCQSGFKYCEAFQMLKTIIE